MMATNERTRWFAMAALLAAALAAGCGDDDGAGGDDDDDDDGTGIDAAAEIDGGGDDDDAGDDADAAGEADAAAGGDGGGEADATPTAAAVLWFHGDVAVNNRDQLGRLATTEGATPIYLPETGSLASGGGAAFGPYDISPAGDRIAFAADSAEPGRFDLYVASADGTGVEPLVEMPAESDVTRVRFSPDGTRIAFRADLDVPGVQDIYVVPVAAPPVVPVRVTPPRDPATPIPTELDAEEVVWRNDSTRLAVRGDFTEADYQELLLVDLAVEMPTPVKVVGRDVISATTEGAKGVLGPIEFTADGRLVFKTRLEADGRFRLHTADADGNDLAVLAGADLQRPDGTPAQIGTFAVAPGGGLLAFAADALVAETYEVFVVPVGEAGPAVRITSGAVPAGGNPSFFRPFAWSPDETRVAFLADYGLAQKFEPYVASVAGEPGEVRLAIIGDAAADNQDADDLAWSPDGAALYIIADHVANNDVELFALDPAIAEQVPVPVHPVPEGGDFQSVRATR
jgi:dipeptidyl aminopeptidase/acylaminoacyl peptidase